MSYPNLANSNPAKLKKIVLINLKYAVQVIENHIKTVETNPPENLSHDILKKMYIEIYGQGRTKAILENLIDFSNI